MGVCVVSNLQRFLVQVRGCVVAIGGFIGVSRYAHVPPKATPDGLELYELGAYVTAMEAAGSVVAIVALEWARPRGARDVLARVYDIARAGFDWVVEPSGAAAAAVEGHGDGAPRAAAAATDAASAVLTSRLRSRVLARTAGALDELRPQSMLELRRAFLAVDADGSGSYVAAARARTHVFRAHLHASRRACVLARIDASAVKGMVGELRGVELSSAEALAIMEFLDRQRRALTCTVGSRVHGNRLIRRVVCTARKGLVTFPEFVEALRTLPRDTRLDDLAGVVSAEFVAAVRISARPLRRLRAFLATHVSRGVPRVLMPRVVLGVRGARASGRGVCAAGSSRLRGGGGCRY